MESYGVTIQMKLLWQQFHKVLKFLAAFYKRKLIENFVDCFPNLVTFFLLLVNKQKT